MTQSLSNLMNAPWAVLLLISVLLLFILLLWIWFQRKSSLKNAVTAGQNHPSIPRKMYKLSEVRQSQLELPAKPTGNHKIRVPANTEAYHIPAGLWDV